MPKRRTWYSGKNTLWYVFGKNNSVWLSTASFTKRGAIQNWENQQHDGGKPWRWWSRAGFKCRRADIRFAFAE